MAIYMYFFPVNTGMDFVFGSNMVMRHVHMEFKSPTLVVT